MKKVIMVILLVILATLGFFTIDLYFGNVGVVKGIWEMSKIITEQGKVIKIENLGRMKPGEIYGLEYKRKENLFLENGVKSVYVFQLVRLEHGRIGRKNE